MNKMKKLKEMEKGKYGPIDFIIRMNTPFEA